MAGKRENFYRRDPSKAMSGMIGLTLEERGVYNTVIDLLYSTWRPLEDDRAFIAGWCGCAVQKLNPIVNRLIEKGRLIAFTEGARTFLSDEAFEAERAAVKGPAKTRSGRGEVAEKSVGVEEKSAGVEQNTGLLDDETSGNQSVTALEKTREDQNREERTLPIGSDAKASWPDGLFEDDDPLAEMAALPVAKGCWRLATLLLTERGRMAESKARSFIGRLKGGGLTDDDLWEIAEAAWKVGTQDPCAYLTKAAEGVIERRGGGLGITAPSEKQQRAWAEDWRDKGPGGWKRWERGPCPGEPGCRVSPAIIAEFTRERISA